jgi:hypothetical protein
MTTQTVPGRWPGWMQGLGAMVRQAAPDGPAPAADATSEQAADAALAAQQAQRLTDALGGAVWVSYL